MNTIAFYVRNQDLQFLKRGWMGMCTLKGLSIQMQKMEGTMANGKEDSSLVKTRIEKSCNVDMAQFIEIQVHVPTIEFTPDEPNSNMARPRIATQ